MPGYRKAFLDNLAIVEMVVIEAVRLIVVQDSSIVIVLNFVMLPMRNVRLEETMVDSLDFLTLDVTEGVPSTAIGNMVRA